MKYIKPYIIQIIIFLIVFSSGCVTGGNSPVDSEFSLQEVIEKSADSIAKKLPTDSRVVITSFISENDALSEFIIEELTGALFVRGVEVADRQNLAYVHQELDFHMSGDVSDETARSVGKFLAADLVITGSLTYHNNIYRYQLDSLNVFTVIRSTEAIIDVKADSNMKRMVAAITKQNISVRSVKYGVSENKTPKTAGAFLDRGIMLAVKGEYFNAISDFTEAIIMNPNLSTAFALRGRALYASVSEVIDMGENFNIIATISDKEKIISHEQMKIYEQAIANYSEAIRLEPDYIKTYFERGNVYDRKGKYTLAIADFTHAITMNPDISTLYTSRGISYSNKGDYDLSIIDHTEAIKLDPNSAVVYNGRGKVYKDKSDYNKAIADFSKAIQIDSSYASAYYLRGNTYNDKGDYDRAIVDFTHAIKIKPDYSHAYDNRGFTYYKKGDFDRAVTDFTQAINLDPNASSYNNRGMAYSEKGDFIKAIADFNQAIQFDEQYAGAFFNRGSAYMEIENYDNAILDYTQEIRFNFNTDNVYFRRGIAYLLKDDYSKAIVDFGEALKLNPVHEDAYYYRGMSYMSLKDYVKAFADYEAVLRINPNRARARQYVEMLRYQRGM